MRTGALVTGVEAAHGRVTGVRLAGGERVAADTVIADVMPHALLALAGEHLGSLYRRLLGRYTYGPATVKVDWALDGPIPWLAEEVRGAGTVHVGGGEDELVATIAASARGLPERPFLLLGQQTVADPTRAPEGRHTAWAYTHGPQRGRRLGGRARPRTSSAWRRRWSATRPGSATGSWPGTCSDRPGCRNATATWSAVTWAAAATGSTR